MILDKHAKITNWQSFGITILTILLTHLPMLAWLFKHDENSKFVVYQETFKKRVAFDFWNKLCVFGFTYYLFSGIWIPFHSRRRGLTYRKTSNSDCGFNYSKSLFGRKKKLDLRISQTFLKITKPFGIQCSKGTQRFQKTQEKIKNRSYYERYRDDSCGLI